jgi:hypothetical protein
MRQAQGAGTEQHPVGVLIEPDLRGIVLLIYQR